MTQTFREQLVDRMRDAADLARRQRDQEWQYWYDNGGMFEAIRYPELARPPSQRTAEDVLKIIQRDIQRERGEGEDE